MASFIVCTVQAFVVERPPGQELLSVCTVVLGNVILDFVAALPSICHKYVSIRQNFRIYVYFSHEPP